MAKSDDVKKLEMEIVQLKDELAQLRGGGEPVEISADEMRAFQKVRAVLADPIRECGINECDPCVVIRCWRCTRCIPNCWPCVNECTCGPCNCFSGGGGFGGGGRFGGLGQ